MARSLHRESLKLPFSGDDRIERYYGEAGQDLFVASLLDGKRDGTFLDLGCNQPILYNNTFLLESEFEWDGLAVDIDPAFFEMYVFRKCRTLAADCTRLDWDWIVDRLGTTSIDYLSLDLEPPEVTLECLRTIPFERVEFSVITFEHDGYRSGDAVQEPAREHFEKYGYTRVCRDVRLRGRTFEDWYCDPKKVEAARIERLKSEDQEWENVLFAADPG